MPTPQKPGQTGSKPASASTTKPVTAKPATGPKPATPSKGTRISK